jgi:hypothetical protein
LQTGGGTGIAVVDLDRPMVTATMQALRGFAGTRAVFETLRRPA